MDKCEYRFNSHEKF